MGLNQSSCRRDGEKCSGGPSETDRGPVQCHRSIINKHNFSGSMYIPKEIIGPFFFFQPVVDPMDIYTKSMAKSSLTA